MASFRNAKEHYKCAIRGTELPSTGSPGANVLPRTPMHMRSISRGSFFQDWENPEHTLLHMDSTIAPDEIRLFNVANKLGWPAQENAYKRHF